MNTLSIYPLPGISWTHDASAEIAADGTVLYAYEEERLLRLQHAINTFPERSALVGMRTAGVAPSDIDRLIVTSSANCFEQPDYLARVEFAKQRLGISKAVTTRCVSHHLAHTALSVLTSPYDECAFLTVDGGGDGIMGHWGAFRSGTFQVSAPLAISPALLFALFTSMAGFALFDEGKLMGLAGHGKVSEGLYDWLKDTWRIDEESCQLVEQSPMGMDWVSEIDPSRVDLDRLSRQRSCRLKVSIPTSKWPRELRIASREEIAATTQQFFTDLIIKMALCVARKTGMRHVACSGGAFQNVRTHAQLAATDGIEVHVPVAPHDAGLALGASLLDSWDRSRTRPRGPLSPYCGPSATALEAGEVLSEFGIAFEQPEDFLEQTASYIRQGKVVGWFDGRGEIGARSLGARSVLADPRNPLMRQLLNQRLKKRDWFMPYAPAVLHESGDAVFEDYDYSPYMNRTFQMREEWLKLVPAAAHVDGTCRAQSVTAALSQRFHRLITLFRAQTGVPMILNTSFNDHGVPMVATPKQAVEYLLRGCVDVLAIEGLLAKGRESRDEAPLVPDSGYLLASELRHIARLVADGEQSEARRRLAALGVKELLVAEEGIWLGSTQLWRRGADPRTIPEMIWFQDGWRLRHGLSTEA